MPMQDPPHPGEIVMRECIEPLGLTVAKAAEGLGVSHDMLSDLVNEKSGVTVEMADRLSGLSARRLRRGSASKLHTTFGKRGH